MTSPARCNPNGPSAPAGAIAEPVWYRTIDLPGEVAAKGGDDQRKPALRLPSEFVQYKGDSRRAAFEPWRVGRAVRWCRCKEREA